MASLLEPYQKYVLQGNELKYRAFPHSVNAKDDPSAPSDSESWQLPLLQTSNDTESDSELFKIPELPANLSAIEEALDGKAFARNHHQRHERATHWGREEMRESVCAESPPAPRAGHAL